MTTVSLKLPASLEARLTAEARRQRTTKSALIRDAAEKAFAKQKGFVSCADLAGDLIGSQTGSHDASTNKAYLDGNAVPVMQLVQKRVIEVGFELGDHVPELLTLMRRYRGVPMSLADACLVRMSELHRQCRVMITDTDFRRYRRNARHGSPLIAPW